VPRKGEELLHRFNTSKRTGKRGTLVDAADNHQPGGGNKWNPIGGLQNPLNEGVLGDHAVWRGACPFVAPRTVYGAGPTEAYGFRPAEGTCIDEAETRIKEGL